MTTYKQIGMLAVALTLLVTPPALADSHKHGKSGKSGKTTIAIGSDDRTILRGYLAEGYQAKCPPGLAKKHNGCLPPGQAKKRYIIGEPLPRDVVFFPVPDDILVRLHPAPVGYRYVQVDTDILLIGEATKKVIDAVTLLSAVGN